MPSEYTWQTTELPSGAQEAWVASIACGVSRRPSPPRIGTAHNVLSASTTTVDPSGDTAPDMFVPAVIVTVALPSASALAASRVPSKPPPARTPPPACSRRRGKGEGCAMSSP
ncbi:hypothetical protein GCM10009533_32200 [Saccharopolyspora spinosporotrichia]|uniref:Uncharacterized protein n=1 Tax=Saccharopolyspora erythraea TaxID=1836 RepID=A0ABP3MYF6_SACER